MIQKVLIYDIEKSLGFSIDERIRDRIILDGLEYEPLNSDEFTDYILTYLKVLNDDDLKIAGQHRKSDWEEGWGQNLREFADTGLFDALIPKYHTKSNIARFNGKVIKTFDPQFDFKLHSYFVDAVLYKYASVYRRICEFGCGTGYHLFRFNQTNPHHDLVGLDWSKSSQDTIDHVVNALDIDNISSHNFDYFAPNTAFPAKDSCVYTVASLEQVGDRHKEFVDYLVAQKPKLCIHFEPISEVLDDNNLLDYLTKRYFTKRHYLKDFVPYLTHLQDQNKISILDVRRLNYGSQFVEGHTLVLWKPL